MNPLGILKSIPFLAMALPATAAIISTDLVSDTHTSFDAGVVPSLITTGQSSLASVNYGSVTPDIFTVAGLNNGSASDADANATLTFYGALQSNQPVITFNLDKGYDITSIQSLSGWGDSYFGSQYFTVGLETGFSGTYVGLTELFGESPYTTSVELPAPPGFPIVADGGFAVLTTITENVTGIVGSNVTGIRFTFMDPYPLIPGFDGTVFRELSVFGTATVPEPSSFLVVLLGGCLVMTRRHRA